MKEYIYALTGAVIMGELFLLLMPAGKLKPFARSAVSMAVLLMLIMPIRRCELPVQWEETTQDVHKQSYSDIIMDIYTEAGERSDG